MSEFLENKKDLEPVENLPSQTDSDKNLTISGIIPQEDVNDNEVQQFDFFTSVIKEEHSFETAEINQPLSILQEVYEELNVDIEEDQIYKAKVVRFELQKIKNSDTTVLNWILMAYDERNKSKEIAIPFFFSKKRKCLKFTIEKLREILKMFNFSLKREHLMDLQILVSSIEDIKDTWVEIVPSVRIDDNNHKKYENYEIVKVIGKNYDLGGVL